MNPYLFGLAAVVLLGAAAVVAKANDPRASLVGVAVTSVAAAFLYALLGAYEAMAAQAIFFGGGALAFFLVVRSMRVAAPVTRAPAVRPVRAALASLAMMAVLAKAQLGETKNPGAPAPLPLATPSPTLVAPSPGTLAASPSAVAWVSSYVLPGGLALLVLVTGLVGAPPLPRRPRRAAEENA